MGAMVSDNLTANDFDIFIVAFWVSWSIIWGKILASSSKKTALSWATVLSPINMDIMGNLSLIVWLKKKSSFSSINGCIALKLASLSDSLGTSNSIGNWLMKWDKLDSHEKPPIWIALVGKKRVFANNQMSIQPNNPVSMGIKNVSIKAIFKRNPILNKLFGKNRIKKGENDGSRTHGLQCHKLSL